jgi:tetratricopeptide (TPR) repeat protein/DNA-binding XRE family transcriptional regulator
VPPLLFGELLRSHRHRARLTQEQLAERATLSPRTVRALEGGWVGRPRLDSVRLLADGLGLTDGPREEFEAAAWDGHRAERPGSPAGPARRPPSGALCQLPPDVVDFTGRAEQVALVGDLLADAAPGGKAPAVVVSAVAGKAGVGKTALAVHLAHRLRPRFPDGQLYVNLRGADSQPLDPGEVLSRLLRTLGVDGAAIPADVGERSALYRAWLADRRVLVVLDDAASEAQVRPLLPGTAGCGVLATSRAPLVGLEGARLLDLEVLPPEQAVELLGRIAGAARVAAEPQAATAIVGYCGRLPLAVRIAGAKLAGRPHWPLERLAGLLADERSRLDHLAVGDLEVRASVALSYRALTGNQQRTFRLLGLLEAPDFAAWAAAALLDITTEQAEELVDGLVQAQLLELGGRDQTGQVRFRFHDLLRLYARERATAEDPPEQRQASLARALSGWLALADQADQRLPSKLIGVDHGAAARWSLSATTIEALLADPLAWLEAERAALVAAVDQAADAGLDELAWDLAGSLINFLDLRRYLDDWQRTHQAGLAAARRAGDRQGEASLLRGFGYLGMDRDSLTVAMDYFTQALPIYRQAGDRRGEAHAIDAVGTVHQIQGRYADAAGCYEQAMTTFVELGDRRGEAWTRFGIAALHAEQGKLATALTEFEEVLAAFQEVGDRRGEARTQRRLGTVHAARGNLDRAAAWLEQGLASMRQFGDRSIEALTIRSLGELYLRRDQRAKARSLFQECVAVARELDDHAVEASALGSLGNLHHLEADQHEAASYLERSAALWRKLDVPLELARTLERLAAVYLNAGSPTAAESAWQEALTLLERIGSPEAQQVADRLQPWLKASGVALKQPSPRSTA